MQLSLRNPTRKEWIVLSATVVYLVAVLFLGILLRKGMTSAGEFPAILNALQTGWQRQFLAVQDILDAQRSARPIRRDAAMARLRQEQSAQEERMRDLICLRSSFSSEAIDRLENVGKQVAPLLQTLAESRAGAQPLDELARFFQEASECSQELVVSQKRRARAFAVFGWCWPLPLLAALIVLVIFQRRRSAAQVRTLGGYLSLPTEQLLEGDVNARSAQLRLESRAECDPVFAQGLEEILRRVRASAQSRERFIAAMSHEIRTPMNGLLGFLSNLKETQLNDQQQQYLRIIESSAKGLVHVINEILDFTKLRAGKLSVSEVSFDLKAFAEERVALARQSVRGKPLRIRLISHPAEMQQLLLRTDPSLLRQILDNLLGNAVKFTNRGEVALEIMATPIEGDSAMTRVDFAVRDSGIGMTQAEQEHLFRPYEQAESSIARRYGGTGLGLTISHALVELLGGRLQVKSSPGEGSCFSFALQCRNARPEEQVHLSDLYHIRLPRTELKKHWALLVDDTLTNLFLLETICQSVGLPYRTAENGREALELCRRQHFDLIFMDIQMPIMDGYTAIREIRKLPDAESTAIVALTASAYQEDVAKALGAGSTGFIPKPFERDQLLLCIAEALGIAPERVLRETEADATESPEAATIRRMHDFMREQYQLSLGEIKMLLAQTLTDWRPLLDNLGSYAQQGNTQETLALLHRLKGQLAAIGLLDHSEKTVAIMDAFRENRREEGQTLILAFIQSLSRIFKLLETDVTLPEP